MYNITTIDNNTVVNAGNLLRPWIPGALTIHTKTGKCEELEMFISRIVVIISLCKNLEMENFSSVNKRQKEECTYSHPHSLNCSFY